ncbi:DGQHR domain-containing protein [Vibrio anguillarum]
MERSQRSINQRRANAFADYLIDNLLNDTGFIIPTVTGYIDSTLAAGEPGFYSALEQCDLMNVNIGYDNVGVLVVAMDAEIKLFDGQHRSYGTYLALNRILSNPQKYSKIDLSSISVPLMAYTNLTLVERQMFFSDINMNMSKPQAAIGIAYDHRDPLARFAVEIAQELPFAGLVELEKNTVSKKSDKLFSMKTIYDVVKSIMGIGTKYTKADFTEEKKQYVREVLAKFSRPMGWSALEFSGTTESIRESSIITHTVMLKAVAEAAKIINAQFPDFVGVDLNQLVDLDYSRDGGDFMGRCIEPVSKNMRMNQIGIKLAANKLILTVGAKLPPEMALLEKQYFEDRDEPKQSDEQEPLQEVKPLQETTQDPQNRRDFLIGDARTMVILAAGDNEKAPNVVTRKAGIVVQTMMDYENTKDISLFPIIPAMKDFIKSELDKKGAAHSWRLVASEQSVMRLIESSLAEVGY